MPSDLAASAPAAAAAFLGSALLLCFGLVAGAAGARPSTADSALLVPPRVHPTPLLLAAFPVLAAFTPLAATAVPAMALGMDRAMFCTAADELSTSPAEARLNTGLIGGLDMVTGSEASMDFTCRSTSTASVAAGRYNISS